MLVTATAGFLQVISPFSDYKILHSIRVFAIIVAEIPPRQVKNLDFPG
jgi:hypothetical protein